MQRRIRWTIALLVMVAAWVGPGVSARAPAAGAVRGRVTIKRPVPVARPRADDVMAGMAMPPEGAVRRQAVVYFENPPETAEAPAEAPHGRMDQKDEAFVPHLLAIITGTVVDFPNLDPVYHNVFSLSPTRRFDLGRYAVGHSKAIKFERPGIVRVFCDIHSHMSAFILVFDHRFFAMTDDEGRYQIDRVPPGTYKVTAWYEGVAQKTLTVTVPPSGATVDLDFNLQ
jgi:plastocyanin